jgi:hypothetical protein
MMKNLKTRLLFALLAQIVAGGCLNPSDSKGQILADMPSYMQYGWQSGAANGGAPNQATYFPITSMVVEGDQVTFAYDWENGIAIGTVSGNSFTGTWTQSNGEGPQLLEFDDNGQFVSGWWADASDPVTHHPAFLLK